MNLESIILTILDRYVYRFWLYFHKLGYLKYFIHHKHIHFHHLILLLIIQDNFCEIIMKQLIDLESELIQEMKRFSMKIKLKNFFQTFFQIHKIRMKQQKDLDIYYSMQVQLPKVFFILWSLISIKDIKDHQWAYLDQVFQKKIYIYILYIFMILYSVQSFFPLLSNIYQKMTYEVFFSFILEIHLPKDHSLILHLFVLLIFPSDLILVIFLVCFSCNNPCKHHKSLTDLLQKRIFSSMV